MFAAGRRIAQRAAVAAGPASAVARAPTAPTRRRAPLRRSHAPPPAAAAVGAGPAPAVARAPATAPTAATTRQRAPLSVVLRSHAPSAAAASAEADRLAASLATAEESDDVMLVADVLAEARVSGVVLPAHSLEAGVRALANGGQFKRAAALLRELPWATSSSTSAPPLPHPSTVHALFLASVQAPLAASEDACQRADAARAVLDALAAAAAGGQQEGHDLSHAYNRVVRAYARVPGGGRLDAALELLGAMCSDDRVSCDASTFGALAAACIDAGRAELAEEVLDMRDYL
jgi:hypothetical protein